jgi:hypothetical protein
VAAVAAASSFVTDRALMEVVGPRQRISGEYSIKVVTSADRWAILVSNQ